MKRKLFYYSFWTLIFYVLTACHMIDVPVTTRLTPDVFPQDSLQFIQTMGTSYSALRGNYALDYWFMQSLSTDEAILPARGGNWYDNQNYLMLHYHNWTPDHPWTNSCWSWLSRIIGTSNQALSILNESIPANAGYKNSTVAELKTVRALAYFMMMDLYGSVPLDTLYGDFNPHPNVPRAQVFSFIESEVNAALPYLSSETGTSLYGRCNKYTAYSLLAKMYLNAEIYTGTPQWDKAITACDNIISSGKYSIEPASSYLRMFYPNNGPQMKEFIFAIPFDPTAAPMPNTNGYMYRARYPIPRSHRARFNMPYVPAGCESTLPEFYAHFNDPNDVRNEQWLTGPQFMSDGVTPITVSRTKKEYDEKYEGSDTAHYTYQVDLTPDVILRRNVATFDCGNDEIAWNMGYRNNKFSPDASSTTRNQNNDMPVFRYSDILLMKAEAIVRGGGPTLGHTATSLVNDVRSNRTTSVLTDDITLEFLYEERSREFASETWHRNDMIRFGKYEGQWGYKTNTDQYRRVFPIPTGARVLNTNLTQNPGY